MKSLAGSANAYLGYIKMNETFRLEPIHLLIPLISGLIGWLTNWVAIKMLFHPKKPLNFGFFVLQGVFIKRQKALAQKLADAVEENLFSHQDIHDKLTSPEFLGTILPLIGVHLEDLITNKLVKLHPLLAMIPESMIQGIKEMILKEFEIFLPEIMEGASEALQKQIDIKKVIKEKIEAFEVNQLESLLFQIMKSEFKMIEYVGGVLGLFIGLFQLGLLYWM